MFPYDSPRWFAIAAVTLLLGAALLNRRTVSVLAGGGLAWLLLLFLLAQVYLRWHGIPAPQAWGLEAAWLVAFAVMFWLGAQAHARELRRLWRLALKLVLLWVLFALGWWMWGDGELWLGPCQLSFAPSPKPSGIFPNGNVLAGAILPVWLWCAVRAFEEEARWPLGLAWWLLSVGLFAAQSRGALLAGLMLLLLLVVCLRPRRDRLAFLFVGGVLALLTAWGCTLLAQAHGAMATSAAEMLTSPASMKQRLGIWRTAWSIGAATFPLGAGLGQFPWQFWLQAGWVLSDHVLPLNAMLAHNLLLQAWAEGGIAGVALWLFLGLLLVARWPYVRRWRAERVAAWAAAGALWVQAQVNVIYWMPVPWLWAAFLTGFACKRGLGRRHQPIYLAPWLALVVAGLGVVQGIQWFQAQRALTDARWTVQGMAPLMALAERDPRRAVLPLAHAMQAALAQPQAASFARWAAPRLAGATPEVPFPFVLRAQIAAWVLAGQPGKACHVAMLMRRLGVPVRVGKEERWRRCD